MPKTLRTSKVPRFVLMSFGWLCLLGLAHSARATATATELPPWRWQKGAFRLSTQTSYFTTHANYDDTRGSFERLPNKADLQLIDVMIRARYNFFSRFSLYSGGTFSQLTTQNIQVEVINAAPTEVHLGADLLLWQKWIRLVTEVEASYSLDPIDINTIDPLTNDGVAYVRGLLFAYKPYSWFNTFAHAGIKYRDEGLATLFTWGAGIEKPFARRFLLGGGVEGYETMIGDDLTENDRARVTDRVNNSSTTFYAYDPAIIEARAWFGWNPIDAWEMRIGYGQSLDGVRAAVGQTVFVNLSYNFHSQPDRGSFQYYRTQRENIRRKTKKAIKEFSVETEKNDPDLFDDEDGFEPNIETDPLTETERIMESK